jgi:hypothetical protein
MKGYGSGDPKPTDPDPLIMAARFKISIRICSVCIRDVSWHCIVLFILATQLFKLLDKYRPETKEAKKERLKLRAVAKAEGKVRYFILSSADI